jgi:hypothetical protein
MDRYVRLFFAYLFVNVIFEVKFSPDLYRKVCYINFAFVCTDPL